MEEQEREEKIRAYVQAYNAFDVEGMMADLDEDIRFENRSDGVVSMRLNGTTEFRQQAERAVAMFTEREQSIVRFVHTSETETEVEISYQGVLSENLPNGLQTGDEIRLQGVSLFLFAENKIAGITDIG